MDGKTKIRSLAYHRQKCADARNKLSKGIDPLREQEQTKEERRKAPTVKDLIEDYIDRHAKRFKKSWAKDEQILNREVVPVWGNRKAADVLKRDVIKLIEGIVERGAPIMANNTFATIRKMFNWAVEQDILQHTPCFGVKLPAPKQSRERVLSEEEIKTFWQSLERTDLSMSTETMMALKLILYTAQRPGEVIGMHTREIDGDWWTIPVERSKNKRAHRVYLTSCAKEIINEAKEKARVSKEKAEIRKARKMNRIPDLKPEGQEYSGYIFPSPQKDKELSIGDTALAVAVGRNLAVPVFDEEGKTVLDSKGKQKVENLLGVNHFTPHDLRRTVATFMAQSGEMDEVIDAVLNHAKQGVIKVYNQYRYDKEKQTALESWERKLKSITTGTASNVVSINSGRRKAA
jgi:integrase